MTSKCRFSVCQALWFIWLSLFCRNPGFAIQELKQKPIEHEVTVTMKMIRVFVTDQNGDPVNDLTRADFSVFDNGIRQSVTGFERHFSPEQPVAATARPRPEPAGRLAPAGRKFILIIDYFHNDIPGVNTAKKSALEFLETNLLEHDEVMLMSYHRERGLVPRTDFIGDVDNVRQAINKIRGIPGTIEGKGEDAWHKIRILQFFSQLKDLALSLNHIDGYKYLLLFSSGVARNRLYEQWSDGATAELGIQEIRAGMHENLHDVSRSLAASSCPVFTINTRGTKEYLDPEDTRGDHTLKTISDFSGGSYFNDGNRRKFISEAIRNATTNYYVLGFYVQEDTDGKYHAIEVSVSRPGCRVRSQAGYYNPKPFQSYSDFEKYLHLIRLVNASKTSLDDALPLDSLSLPYASESARGVVTMVEVHLHEFPDMKRREMDVFKFGLQDRRIVSGPRRGTLEIDDVSLEKVCLYTVDEMRPGGYRTCIVIRDDKTGKSAVGSTVANVRLDGDFQILAPLLLAPNQKVRFFNLGLEESALSIREIFHFLPPDMAPVIRAIQAGCGKICAVVQVIAPIGESGPLDFLVGLDAGDPEDWVRLNARVAASTGPQSSPRVFFFEIELPALEKGAYRVCFEARDKHADRYARIDAPLEIR